MGVCIDSVLCVEKTDEVLHIGVSVLISQTENLKIQLSAACLAGLLSSF